MSSSEHPVRNSGIYRNLPTFDPSFKGLQAIVTGATGISGWNTIRSLLDSPQRWSKIYAVSRSPPKQELLNLLSKEAQSRIEHVSIDLLQTPDKITEALKKAGVQAQYVFFYAYMQPRQPPGTPIWSNAEEMTKVNTEVFRNFIHALPDAGISPKRILLQTGAKNYGVHIGRARTPAIESDPQPRQLASNFYYPQEDVLFEYCKSHPETKWNVVMPGLIFGAVYGAQMNAMYILTIYVLVQQHKKEKIVYPGDWNAWQADATMSTARLTGYLSEWIVLEEKCAGQRFNATDDSPVSADRLFNEVARWYGAEGEIQPPPDDDKDLILLGARTGDGSKNPMGYGPPPTHKVRYTLSQWAAEEQNQKAWREILEASAGKLSGNPFEAKEDLIGIADSFALKPSTLSMTKARRFGWTGFVDTLESSFEVVSDMARLGMLPAPKVEAARPLA